MLKMVKLQNKDNETLGFRLYYNNEYIEGRSYSALNEDEQMQAKKDIFKHLIKERQKEYNEQKENRFNGKMFLNDALKQINNKDYVSILEFKNLLIEYPFLNDKIGYMYQIISGLESFKINDKSISCKDARNRTVYLKYNDSYKLYKNCFII